MTNYTLSQGETNREILILSSRELGDEVAYEANRGVLGKITGASNKLDIAGPESITLIDGNTISELVMLCMNLGIDEITFGATWEYKDELKSYSDLFGAVGVVTRFRIDVGTFDYVVREGTLKKGVPVKNPMHIAEFFQDVKLSANTKGADLSADIEKGIECFERVYVEGADDTLIQKYSSNGKVVFL